MFHFVTVLLLTLPAWAYERQEQSPLPSSPIRVYENSEEEKLRQAPPVQVQQKEQRPLVIIREQPPVQVYSEPLTSQEKLTRARKQAEDHTEDKIKTRLELLRLKDEKARMDKLLNPLKDEDVAAPAQSQHEKPSAPSSSRALLSSDRQYFIHLGMGRLNHHNQSPQQYSDSIERLGSSFTGGLGLYESEKFSIEYTYTFSKHRVSFPIQNPLYNPTNTLFNMHSHSVALKYYIASGVIRPFIGAVGSFNIRSYKTEVAAHHTYDPFFYWNDRSSKAWQAAFVTGAELFISQNIVLGLDLRFYMNIYDLQDIWVQNTDKYYYYTVFQTHQALPEEMSWYNFQGFVRFLF